jgi:hypothetical protein
MKRFSYAAAICASLTAPGFAADEAAVDPALAQFRAAYASGDGLAYVVIKDQTATTSIATARRPDWRQKRVLEDICSSHAMHHVC